MPKRDFNKVGLKKTKVSMKDFYTGGGLSPVVKTLLSLT